MTGYSQTEEMPGWLLDQAWSSWVECDLKAVERSAETFAGGFDESLLASPALEESTGIGVAGAQTGQFGGVELLRERKSVGELANGFEVDAETAGAGDSDQREGAGVREVEVNGPACKIRLAVRAFVKHQRRRRAGKDRTEDHPQRGVGDDVAVAVLRVDEARGAGLLSGRQQRVQLRKRGSGLGEVDLPDVDAV